MNLPVILFVFCIYDISYNSRNVVEGITLSNSLEEFRRYSASTLNLLDLFKRKHDLYHQLLREKDEQILDQKEQLISTQFYCGLTTAKADINNVMKAEHIFDNIPKNETETQLWNFLYLPTHAYKVLVYNDHVTKEEDLQYYQNRFRNFFFRLNDTKFDPKDSDFMPTLRKLILQEYVDEGDKYSIFMNFAATIVRDYLFFCDYHHDKVMDLLLRLAESSNDNVLSHLFEINSSWYLDGMHIKNINILRKAYYRIYRKAKTDIPDIKGFPCQNKNNDNIELPLHNNCGRIRIETTTDASSPTIDTPPPK